MKNNKRSVKAVILILTALSLILPLAACAKPAPEPVPQEEPTQPEFVPEEPELPAEEPKIEEPAPEVEIKTLSCDFSAIGGVMCSVDYPADDFTVTEEPDKTVLTDKSGDFIEFRFIEGVTPEDIEMTFADEYLDYADIAFSDSEQIAGSGEIGNMIRATDGESLLTSWTVETANGTFAVSVFYAQDEVSEEHFMSILDTLEIIYY